MKRVFALLLCVMLVVACFTACGEKEYTDTLIGSSGENIFRHSLGDFNDLDVGVYEGEIITNEVTMPGFLIVVQRNDGGKSWFIIDVYGEYHHPYQPNIGYLD